MHRIILVAFSLRCDTLQRIDRERKVTMLLLNGLQDPIAFVIFLLALVGAVTVHEFAHAFVADRLGDPTARHAGRITLNPLAHLDPMGSIMLLIAGFGWGKPVPIQPRNFSSPAIDELLVALAGPGSNLIQAIVLGALARSLALSQPELASLLVLGIELNIILMLFNLLPVPPLDGSKLLRPFLGEEAFRTLESLSLPLVIGLFLILQTTSLGVMLSEAAQQLTTWILGV